MSYKSVGMVKIALPLFRLLKLDVQFMLLNIYVHQVH